MTKIITSWITTLCVLITGCSGIQYKSIPSTPLYLTADGKMSVADSVQSKNEEALEQNLQADLADTGIRFLDTSPYLLIYPDGEGGISSQIYYLPDPSKKRSVRPFNKWASLEATLEFDPEKGLIKHSEKVDSTAVPLAFIGALKKAVPLITDSIANATDADREFSLQAPYLYKIIREADGWTFIGGQGIPDTIKIRIDPGAYAKRIEQKQKAKPKQ